MIGAKKLVSTIARREAGAMAVWLLAALAGQAAAQADSAAAAPASEASASSASAAAAADASSAPAPAPIASAAEAPAVPAAFPPGIAAQVDQPRAYGLVLGDVLRQRVLLPTREAAADPARWPPAGRVDLWLERRTPRVDTDADGRRWLVVDYQVVNAPQTLVTVALPAFLLPVGTGLPLRVAAWPLSIGPLISTAALPSGAAPGGLQTLQPDRQVAPMSTTALRRQFAAALAAAVASAAAWAGWWAWRRWRDTRRLPFAQAWRDLAPLRRAGPLSEQPAAWQLLHHAMNATAGRVIHRDSLPRLVAAAPHLQRVRPQLDEFYARSAERFFASPGADHLAALPTRASTQQADPLLTLSRVLRDLEQAHAR